MSQRPEFAREIPRLKNLEMVLQGLPRCRIAGCACRRCKRVLCPASPESQSDNLKPVARFVQALHLFPSTDEIRAFRALGDHPSEHTHPGETHEEIRTAAWHGHRRRSYVAQPRTNAPTGRALLQADLLVRRSSPASIGPSSGRTLAG